MEEHCKALSTLSQQSETVAEKSVCRRKRRLSPKTARKRRQSHFSATVWSGLKFPSRSRGIRPPNNFATCLKSNQFL